MSKNFEQLSTKSGFMKHNGGLLFKEISKTEYEFKTNIDKNHFIFAIYKYLQYYLWMSLINLNNF